MCKLMQDMTVLIPHHNICTLQKQSGTSQQQDVTELSRDAAHANQTLSPIFDKEKEQNRLAVAQKIGEIGRQVSDVLVTQGKLNSQAVRR